jgi:hypothetical protein
MFARSPEGLTDELRAEADTNHGFPRGNCFRNQGFLGRGVKASK